jgi:hypothetical protein
MRVDRHHLGRYLGGHLARGAQKFLRASQALGFEQDHHGRHGLRDGWHDHPGSGSRAVGESATVLENGQSFGDLIG